MTREPQLGTDNEPPRTTNLRAEVVRGVGWVLSAQTAIRIIGFGTTVVLVRLLGPRNVGLATEALVFTRLAFLFSDVGMRAVLVQRKTLSEVDRSTAFWTSVVVGAIVSLAVVALAQPIANLFGKQEVRPLVATLSLYVFFTALGVTPGGLLARQLRFRTLELRTVAAAAAGAVSAIVVAALGYGPWAIVTQLVVDAGVSTALLWLNVRWRPRFTYSRESLRGLAGIGGYVFGGTLASYLHRNADNFLVGRFLGPTKLGAYSAAYDVMQWPLLALGAPMWNVFFPAMAKIGEAKPIGDMWIRVTRLAFTITAPAYLGMVVLAPDFVPVVFGSRWHAAVPVLQILCYVGLVQSLTILVANVLLTLDRAPLFFWLTAGGSLVMVGAFAFGLQWGLLGVTGSYAVANTPVTALFILAAARTTGIPFAGFLRAMAGVFGAAAVMAAAAFGLRLVLVHERVSPAARLAILVPIGILVFGPLCARAAREVVSEVRALVRDRGRAAPQRPAETAALLEVTQVAGDAAVPPTTPT
jgi:O-antigen/teichoic acid export membrane protein